MTERFMANIGAKIKKFQAKLKKVDKTVKKAAMGTEVPIDADTSKAKRKMLELQAIKTALNDKIVIPIDAKVDKFQRRMDRLAKTIHTLGTIGGNMVGGSMLAISPALIPVLASVVGLIGALGPILTVAGSNVVALGAAFGVAGGAAIAFGAAAAPTIKSIIDGTAKATAVNKKAMKSFDKLKDTWEGVLKAIAPEVAKAFANAMQAVEKALSSLEPMFKNVAKTVTKLSKQFNKFMDSKAAKDFFGYLNKNAGPVLEKIVQGVGGLVKGFMNLTVAFKPLIDFAADGFKNMGESFADFTARVKKSKGLQTFISYVKTNGPKIMGIVKNIGSGLIGMFTAFAPLAADMVSGFHKLTARLKDWGQSLSDNQQFQKFIGYIRENGPVVMSTIGNIIKTLVNLGVAMAPIGSKILELVNGFFSWTSSMLKTHPIIGKIFAGLLIGVGVLQMLIPLVVGAITTFSGFGTMVFGVFTKIIPIFNTFKLLFTTGLKLMAQSLGTFILNFLKATGTFILIVLKMGVTFLGTVTQMIATALVWSTKMIANIIKVAAKYSWLAIKAVVHATKIAATFTVTMLKAAAKGTASLIASMAKMIAKYAWMGAKSLVHAAKVAASWVVAMGPVGWVIATIVGLVAVIIANWDKIKAWTVKTWNKIWGSIKGMLSNIWNKVKGVFSKIGDFIGGIDLYESGKKIIGSVIKGIKSMIGKVTSTVKNIAGKIRDFFPFSPAKTGPLSDIHKMDFAGPISTSINRAKKPLQRSMTGLAAAARNSFQSDLVLADIGVSSAINSGTMKPIQHAFSVEVEDFELPEQKDQYAVINIGGHEAKGVIKYFSDEQSREQEREERFR